MDLGQTTTWSQRSMIRSTKQPIDGSRVEAKAQQELHGFRPSIGRVSFQPKQTISNSSSSFRKNNSTTKLIQPTYLIKIEEWCRGIGIFDAIACVGSVCQSTPPQWMTNWGWLSSMGGACRLCSGHVHWSECDVRPWHFVGACLCCMWACFWCNTRSLLLSLFPRMKSSSHPHRPHFRSIRLEQASTTNAVLHHHHSFIFSQHISILF